MLDSIFCLQREVHGSVGDLEEDSDPVDVAPVFRDVVSVLGDLDRLLVDLDSRAVGLRYPQYVSLCLWRPKAPARPRLPSQGASRTVAAKVSRGMWIWTSPRSQGIRCPSRARADLAPRLTCAAATPGSGDQDLVDIGKYQRRSRSMDVTRRSKPGLGRVRVAAIERAVLGRSN